MDLEQEYRTYRPLLFSISYKLLGVVSEAEGVVQDVFMSLQTVDRDRIENMKAFLCKAAANRCLNVLKSAKKKREVYPGTWLPEPLHSDGGSGVGKPWRRIEQIEDMSFAYLVMLERLSPVERTVFVLREAYGMDYSDISELVNKSQDNCRKIMSRASGKVKKPHHEEDRRSANHAVVMQFIAALRKGHIPDVVRLLSDEVVFVSDAGGKTRAAVRPLAGIERVAAFLRGIAAKGAFEEAVDPVAVNGGTGLKTIQEGRLRAVWCFEFVPGSDKIARVYAIYNPDKLGQFM